MSSFSKKISKLLEESFPNYRVRTEKYVMYQNTELFFDFFIPELRLFIEVQGQQHYSFNKFFHKDRREFDKQLVRDKLKTAWVAENNYKLMSLKYSEVEAITAKEFKAKVLELL